MLGIPDLEVEKISSSTCGWKRILVALNGEVSEPRQLKLPPQTAFAAFLERSSALHGLGKLLTRRETPRIIAFNRVAIHYIACFLLRVLIREHQQRAQGG